MASPEETWAMAKRHNQALNNIARVKDDLDSTVKEWDRGDWNLDHQGTTPFLKNFSPSMAQRYVLADFEKSLSSEVTRAFVQ